MKIHLTFDDSAGSATEAVLDQLREFDVRATFFMIGRNVEEAPWCLGDADRARHVMCRAILDGHEIGNHSYSHNPSQFGADFVRDVLRCDQVITSLYTQLGEARRSPIPARLPYGIQILNDGRPNAPPILDPRVALLSTIGRTHFHWTSLFDDWLETIRPEQIVAAMVAHTERLASVGVDPVLVLHDGTEKNEPVDRSVAVHALRSFLQHAVRKNWSFSRPTA